MKIKLNEIYAQLEAWRAERKITAESQKEGYIINIMEEFGELATVLREKRLNHKFKIRWLFVSKKGQK